MREIDALAGDRNAALHTYWTRKFPDRKISYKENEMSDTPKNANGAEDQKRHWLDHAAVWVASAAALPAAAAAVAAAWQAHIANQQLAVARDTEVRQLRAYLYVRRYTIVADQMTAAAKIEINHAGATPAYNIRLDAMILVDRYLVGEPKLPDVTSQSVGGVDRSQYSILYSTENISKVISLPADSHEAMHLVWSKDAAIGDQRLYLFGVVRYLDIFGVAGLQPERRYEFCFVYHPERDPIGSERGCEKFNKPG